MTDERCQCEGAWGLFIWRGDPEWWSCVGCDQRVRPLTETEKAERMIAAPDSPQPDAAQRTVARDSSR